jgi:hypothetical protein
MSFTILPPSRALPAARADSDDSDGGVVIDSDGDVAMTSTIQSKALTALVTPGDLVTDDPQWMR